jgi:hypothetical protein
MYCDCVLARAGFTSGYIVVFVISAFFVGAAIAVLAGGWRTASFASMESIKDRMLLDDER